jgi:hypothetical protein
MSQGPSATPELSDQPGLRSLVLLFGGIALVLLVLVVGFEEGVRDRVPQWVAKIPWNDPPGRPWGKRQWDARLGDLSLLAGTGVLVYAMVRRQPWSQRPQVQKGMRAALIALLLASSFIYFYARRAQLPTYVHRWDTYHYLLGPKYYEELGYYGLYDCTVEAMGPKRVRNRFKIKNLRTYATGTAKEARERIDCAERFGPERWAEFKSDIDTYVGMSSAPHIRSMMQDHGYNGAPFHATAAGLLANSFDLSLDALNRATLFDAFGLMMMLALLTWAFGWKLGLLFGVYFLTNFVDRAGATGASFFRVQWMVALGISMAMLHRKKYGWAAALLVIASMLNVFPILFSVAILAKMGLEFARTRDLREEYKRFLKSAAITTAICAALSVSYGNGVSNYENFFENMAHHSQGPPNRDGTRRERIPGFGVGLKFTFLYRGEHTKKGRKLSRRKKSDQFKQIKWIYKGVAGALVGLALLIAVRLEDLEGSILFGFTAFFCLLGTVGYYFACASLIIVMWQKKASTPGGALMLAGFFACSVLAHRAYVATGSAEIAHNTVMSYAWLAYLLLMLAILGHETRLFRDAVAWIAPPPHASSASASEPTLDAPAGSPSRTDDAGDDQTRSREPDRASKA